MPLTQQVPPIARGYHYALQIGVSTDDDGPFQDGATIVAFLRDYEGSALVGQLSTTDGTLYLDDEHHVELQVPAALTARLSNSSALVEFVRTDGGEPEWLDLALRLPVYRPGGASLGASTAIVLSDQDVSLARCPARLAATPQPTPTVRLAFNLRASTMYLGAC